MPEVTTPVRPLSSLEVGEVASVVTVDVSTEWRGRLNAMGISMGKRITLLRKAGLNGPLQLRVGTTELAIRRCEAALIGVRPNLGPR